MKRLALDSVDTSRNRGDIGTKARPKDRPDSLLSQLPMRRTGVTTTMIFAGVVAAARTDVQEDLACKIRRFGDSYLMIYLAKREVMAIVILVFALSIALSPLCCWSCFCLRRRLGAAEPAQARLGAAPAQASGIRRPRNDKEHLKSGTRSARGARCGIGRPLVDRTIRSKQCGRRWTICGQRWRSWTWTGGS